VQVDIHLEATFLARAQAEVVAIEAAAGIGAAVVAAARDASANWPVRK
jgi:hypothetical protein